MIVLQVHIEAHLPHRRELVHALSRWAEAVRRQPELDCCRLLEDLEAPGHFSLMACWRDEAALEAHFRSEPFGVLQGALEVLARPARFEVLHSVEYSPQRKVAK